MACKKTFADKAYFYDIYYKWATCEMPIDKAAKALGASEPTVRKYFNMFVENNDLPNELFINGNKK